MSRFGTNKESKERPFDHRMGVGESVASKDVRASTPAQQMDTERENNRSQNALREARKVQARSFLQALVPLVAKNERITKERLRDLVIGWRETHKGEEGGENLFLAPVVWEAIESYNQAKALQKNGWYVENASVMRKVLGLFYRVDIDGIDYELEFGRPPLEEDG